VLNCHSSTAIVVIIIASLAFVSFSERVRRYFPNNMKYRAAAAAAALQKRDYPLLKRLTVD